MKTKNSIEVMNFKLKGLLFILLTTTSLLLFSQGNTGQMEGIIKDRQTGEVLPYATVGFQGINIGAATDDKGFYQIKGIKSGEYKVSVGFVGYQDTTFTVSFSGNDKLVRNISLKLEGTDVEEVVVTAQAFGQMKAINNQLNATSITNVVSDVKIRELPDANAAEALSRLPGVTISREGGEATGIKIRGVQANTIYVNGMRMEGGLGSVASSMIGGIELTKAFMPDQDADILGGAVDFKMREAPGGFKKEITLRQGYNSFNKSFKMQDASLLLSNRFFGDRLGVMLSGNWDRKNRGRDTYYGSYAKNTSKGLPETSYTLVPVQLTNVTLQSTESLNNRYGVTLFTDYKLSFGKVYYQGFYSNLAQDNVNTENSYNTGGSINYNATGFNKNEKNFLNGIGGDFLIGRVKIDFGASMSSKKEKTPYRLNYNSEDRGGFVSNGVDTTTTINQFLALGRHELDKVDVASAYKSGSTYYTDELGLKLNIEIPFKLGKSIDGYFKVGGKVRSIDRGADLQSVSGDIIGYSPQRIGEDMIKRLPDFGWVRRQDDFRMINHASFAAQPLEQDFSMLGAKTYFMPDFNRVRTAVAAVDELLYHTLYSDKDDYTNKEDIYAGYIMTGINFGKLITFTPGVRYENDTYSTSAKYLAEVRRDGPLAAQGTLRDTTGGSFNEKFFPMIHMKIKPASWFDIRLAYTKTCSRPGFDLMSPKFYQTSDFTVEMGNVYLKPQTNTNYDAYLSFFTGKLGLFTAGAFYKKIEDQVVNYKVVMIDQTLYGFTNDAYRNKNYSKPINNQWPGYIQGLELDWQTQFSYLPSPFNGIILNANVTFFDSQTKYPFFETKPVYLDPAVSPYQFSEAINTYRESKVIGSSDIVGNVSLGYELGGFSGRISGYYQGFTTTDQKDVTNISLDENRDHFLRVDMQLSQKIKSVEGLMIYLNLSNLTNNPDRIILTHYQDRVRSEERYGASGDIGIRYRF